MEISDGDLNAVAARLLADYDAINPGAEYAEGLRLGISESWRLQTAVTRLREARGEKVIGYKVGCTSAGNQKMMGVSHPVWGRLWESELHDDGALLAKSDYKNIAIEAEFGIVLSQDIVAGQAIEEYVDAVAALYPLLELHNLVLRSDPPHAHELIANNCINCGVVRGSPVTDLNVSQETDLKLVFDGEVIDQWPTLRWPQDVLGSLDWLSGSLASRGINLKAGDLILTGAWGPPRPVDNCTRVDVTSSAFGDAFANFK